MAKIVQTAGRNALGEFAPEFAHYNDDVLFGENWNNQDIDVKTRSIITVVALMAQGITDSSLKFHLQNAKAHGVTFLGGHPMAGTQYSGFKNAKATMYHGAPMVIVPPDFDDVLLFDRVKQLLQPAGFSRFSFTTAEAHDEMIAFTSQMAHVVSNAYIKSPTADRHKGFSAGSYKDMTRVAWLSPEMWAELFLENKDNLLHELDIFMAHLGEYRDAMARDDLPALTRLLDEGRRRKEEVDGR